VADAGTAAFNGVGDTLSFANSGGTGAALVSHRTLSPIGLWIDMRTASTANAIEFLGSQTFNALAPYSNSTWTAQTFITVRNTNDVRINFGFTAAALATSMGADNINTNMVFFRYSTAANDSTWKGVVCNATNQTVVDTTVGLTNDGQYFLQFTKTGTNVTFTVNRTTSVTATTNVPNQYIRAADSMATYYGIQTLATGVKTNLVRYIGYSQDFLVK
jgi:hypothetical protein